MLTRKQAARDARQLFRLCLADGLLNETRVNRVVESILRSRRRGYLMLLGYFRRLVAHYVDEHRAKVQSASPVPDDLQASVRDRLGHLYGRGLSTEFSVSPVLIGGMRIQVGSDVYDGSVQFGLNTLQRSLGIESRDGSDSQTGAPAKL